VSEVVRPPDPLREKGKPPARPGFRDPPNENSKAQKSGKKVKK
jgi:hypothetical protein